MSDGSNTPKFEDALGTVLVICAVVLLAYGESVGWLLLGVWLGRLAA